MWQNIVDLELFVQNSVRQGSSDVVFKIFFVHWMTKNLFTSGVKLLINKRQWTIIILFLFRLECCYIFFNLNLPRFFASVSSWKLIFDQNWHTVVTWKLTLCKQQLPEVGLSAISEGTTRKNLFLLFSRWIKPYMYIFCHQYCKKLQLFRNHLLPTRQNRKNHHPSTLCQSPLFDILQKFPVNWISDYLNLSKYNN